VGARTGVVKPRGNKVERGGVCVPACGLFVLLRCVAMCDSVCANWVAREKEVVNTGKTPEANKDERQIKSLF